MFGIYLCWRCRLSRSAICLNSAAQRHQATRVQSVSYFLHITLYKIWRFYLSHVIMPTSKLKSEVRDLCAAKEAKATLQAMTSRESRSFANLHEATALEYAERRPSVNGQADPTTTSQKDRS